MSKLVSKHYPALDGLRGFAALIVVWHHYLQLVPAHGRVLSVVTSLLGFGWMGVDIFFVLSGFLITGILADEKGGRGFFRIFYSRRVLRIFPLYYATLVIILLVLPAVGVQTGVDPHSQMWLWTYTGNFYFALHGWLANYTTHLWTLAIEEQFYLLWPLVIFLMPDLERLRKALPWVVCGVLLTRVILHANGLSAIPLNLFTFTHCDGLLLGSCLALAVRSEDARAMRLFQPRTTVALGVAALALFAAHWSDLIPVLDSSVVIGYMRAVVNLSLLSLVFAWLVQGAVRDGHSAIKHAFSHPLLRWFGKYSYAIYILHVPLGFLVLQAFDLSALSPCLTLIAELGLLVLYFGSCTLAAYASWHLFEQHILKLKRYFPYERKERGEIEPSGRMSAST